MFASISFTKHVPGIDIIYSLLAKIDFWHIGSARSPDLTFDMNTVAMHTALNPIVLHLWTQWHCMELIVNIHRIPIVNYTFELPALSLLLIFQLSYLVVLKIIQGCQLSRTDRETHALHHILTLSR